MFSFTLQCSLNELYPTPFSLPSGTYFVEASSSAASTVAVLTVFDKGRFAQNVLSETIHDSGERILFVHVPAGDELSGLRILRHSPGANNSTSRDVNVTCVSLRRLVNELQEMSAEIRDLRSLCNHSNPNRKN